MEALKQSMNSGKESKESGAVRFAHQKEVIEG